MGQNPYQADQWGMDVPASPERTSVLAIAGLVFALILCVPGFGVIGAVLGVAALLTISSSRGRVGGKGIALTAIVLGLLFTFAWVGIVMGAMGIAKKVEAEMVKPASDFMVAVDAGDFATARTKLSAARQAEATDATLEAFRVTYQSELGSFKTGPTGLRELIQMYTEMGSTYQGSQWSNNQGGGPNFRNAFPIAMQFGKGTAMVVASFDMQGKSQTGFPEYENFTVVLPSGKELWLLPGGNVQMPGGTMVTATEIAGGASGALPAPPGEAGAEGEKELEGSEGEGGARGDDEGGGGGGGGVGR